MEQLETEPVTIWDVIISDSSFTAIGTVLQCHPLTVDSFSYLIFVMDTAFLENYV